MGCVEMRGCLAVFFLIFVEFSVYGLQPVITDVSIPNVSMKIGDVVTATITVQSDSATYTLGAGSDIGGYSLGSLTKLDSTTYTAQFTISEGGTDYAATDDIPTNVTLADGALTSDPWNAPISQDSDPIDANRPTKPATPDLAASSDKGASSSDNITNDNTPTFQGFAGSVEGSSTVTVYSSIDGSLGTTVANADGSWSFTVPSVMSDGTHQITITATDAAGNESVPSDPLPVLIDTQDPPAPTGRNPVDGTYTNDNTPTFSWDTVVDPGGSGVRDYHIIVYDSTHTQVKSSYPSATQYTPSSGSPLADGIYTWKLATRDIAGNTGPWSDELTLTVDTTAPVVSDLVVSDAAVDSDCNATLTFSAKVNDNLCIDKDDATVTVTLESGNATIGAPTITKTQNGLTGVDISGSVPVSALNGCPATVKVTVDATDCSGNSGSAWSTGDAYDNTDPEIASLTVNGAAVGGDCKAALAFTAMVTDNCCVDADSITVTAIGTNITVAVPVFTTSGSGTLVTVTGSVDVHDITGCPASVTITVNAADCCGNAAASASDSVDVIDATAPVISDIAVSDETVDDNCQATVTFSAVVTDNCCVDADSVAVLVTLTSGNATLGTPTITKTQNGQGEVDVTGSVQVSDLNGCPATIQVAVDATDCCGNIGIQASKTGNVTDTTAPVIVWDTELPPSPRYADPNTCTISFPIQATVTDNCCILVQNVSADVSVSANATLVQNVTATQVGDTVVVVGTITVSCLSGCPAVLSVAIDATDCCGNAAAQLTDSVEIFDNTVPVINDLAFYTDDTYTTTNDYQVDSCCLTTVYFTANVTDQCCVHPDGITVDVTLPTNNAVLENIVVDKQEASECPGLVSIKGHADVRCLTGCPARVEVHIEASDCCGNAAVPVTSSDTEGLVHDETPPTAIDDPNGDEDRSSSDGLEVRVDDYGQHRLMVRENTPVRIDLVANDADNCSACTCCGTMWIHDIVDQPGYGTVMIEIDRGDCNGGSVVRYAPHCDSIGPDRFTYRIEDACGNVSDIATVYVEVVRQTVLKDLYLSGCEGEGIDFEIAATDIWVDPGDPGEIPFKFGIDSLPVHGVILGDLADVTYAPHGRTTKEIESASIGLTYVPAEGFTGRDAAIVRFSDPFGGSSTALVDIVVVGCEQTGFATVSLHRGSILSIYVPAGFTGAYESGAIAWTVTGKDGSPYPDAISAERDEGLGAYVLVLDTGGLEAGGYTVTIPLGTGEVASFTLEVEG